jgi:hypothetical protein
MHNLLKLSLWGPLCHLMSYKSIGSTRYFVCRGSPILGSIAIVTILANRARELHDKQQCLIIPITKLNQDFTELLNNKVLYCDVAYKGLNLKQHILEIVRVNLPLAWQIAVPGFSKCLQEICSISI